MIMQTYRIDRFATLDGLALHERPTLLAGPHEVVVRVHARSLNYRDLLILHQRYPVAAAAGIVPVSDGAGEVAAVGDGVTRFVVGDPVAGSYFPRWQDGPFTLALASEQFGCTRDGMLADAVVASEEAFVKIRDHLSYDEAATLPCAGVTAWAALTAGGAVLTSDTVLTIGTGGVALFALQLAKLAGARVVAVTSTAEKAELLRGHGADVAISSAEHSDWELAVQAATDGRGVDHVVETGGLDTLPRSLASCAAGADLALVAALGTGTLDARALSAPVTIRRLYVGSRTQFETLNRVIAHHGLHPVIGDVFPFAKAREAYAHLEAKRHVGKVVISG
jgi:NADPH:quinone reductase-like Zn-dependent oxidoreductase